MKAKLFWILFSIALLLTTLNLSLKLRTKVDTKAVDERNDSRLLAFLKRNIFEQYRLNAMALNPETKLKDTLDNLVNLADLVKQDSKLILRVYGKCPSCIIENIEQEIETIKKLPLKKQLKIVLLMDFQNIREFYTFKKKYNLAFEAYYISSADGILSYEINGKGIYYFTMDRNFKTKNVFIPIVGDTDLSSRYLDYIDTISF